MEKKYWIYKVIWMCPVCGKEKYDRIRKYTKKPLKVEQRQTVRDYYDWCNE